jgi:hypothetical protein
MKIWWRWKQPVILSHTHETCEHEERINERKEKKEKSYGVTQKRKIIKPWNRVVNEAKKEGKQTCEDMKLIHSDKKDSRYCT